MIAVTVLSFSSDAVPRPRLSQDVLLLLGSSTIANWSTVREDFPDFQVIQKGIGGTTFADLVRTAWREVRKYKPNIVGLYSGDNDLAFGGSPEKVERDLRRTIEIVRAQKPDVEIFVISIKPSPGRIELLPKIREANRRIKNLCERMNITYIDVHSSMFDDNGEIDVELFDVEDTTQVHMDGDGYRLWTKIVNYYLKLRSRMSVAGIKGCATLLNR